MSIEIARRQILKFVESPDPAVLALRGPWGAGKTHAWKEYLLEAKSNESIGLEKYAYVSLFGADSISALKTAIFERSVSGKNIGITPSIEASAEGIANAIKYWKTSIRMLSGLFNDHKEAVEYLSFSYVRDSLICLDDLERRSDNLPLKDVLGLVSHLKEEKGCKIVLILNDAEKNLGDYFKYREKVIDIELKYDPTPLECARLAFAGREDEACIAISSLSTQVEVRNIRILRKADQLARDLLPSVAGFEESLRKEIFRSLTFYVWSAYGSSEGAPPLDYLANSRQRIFAISSDDDNEKLTEEEQSWEDILQSIDFSYVDEIDLLLIEGVQAGYFDLESLCSKLESKNAEVVRRSGQEKYSAAWGAFHHSFDDNSVEVIDTLYREFMENAKHITPTNLDGTVRLLKELGEPEKASEVLDTYIAARSDEPEIFNLEDANIWGNIQDADLIRRFREVALHTQEPRSLSEVLLSMATKNGWSKEEEKVLLATTEEDYFELFKAYQGENLRRIVRQSLQFKNIVNADPEQKASSERAEAALKKIAAENELNRLRLSTYDLNLDP